MSEKLHNSGAHGGDGNGDHGHGDYEREDFTTGAIVGSLIGLIVLCVVSFFIVVGMYHYLEKTQMEHASGNPMVELKADTRHMTPAKDKNGKDDLSTEPMEIQAFPKPRLQDDDVKDMRQQLYGEESTLQSYGWVDQEAGQARIPIARAMELTAERGLSVRGEAAAKPSTATPVPNAQGKSKKAAK
jgi:hypothetical protein